MRALSFALICAAITALASPVLAHPRPPGGEGCPGARPGEEVVYCEYLAYPQQGWGNGAYDAGGLREWRYDREARWSDEDAPRERWDGHVERRGYIDLDAFVRSHSAQFESGWSEERGARWDGWSERERRAEDVGSYEY
ncbi:MAG TPA: hypothetical protein VFE13_15540 [Caulobacteraceae bacterium]|jgi:hypothetical protein|nr:hypothetical protein [Caulobacteraceae bacterium]